MVRRPQAGEERPARPKTPCGPFCWASSKSVAQAHCRETFPPRARGPPHHQDSPSPPAMVPPPLPHLPPSPTTPTPGRPGLGGQDREPSSHLPLMKGHPPWGRCLPEMTPHTRGEVWKPWGSSLLCQLLEKSPLPTFGSLVSSSSEWVYYPRSRPPGASHGVGSLLTWYPDHHIHP